MDRRVALPAIIEGLPLIDARHHRAEDVVRGFA